MAAPKWRALIKQKAFRGELLAAFWYGTSRTQNVRTFHFKKRGADPSWQMQNVVLQNGTDGRCQHETPDKEELEFLRHSTDLCFEGVLMRQAYYAEKSSVWASYLAKFQITDRLRRFIMVNHHEAVHGVEECCEAEDHQLTLPAEKECMLRTLIDTTDVGDSRWQPPFVDARPFSKEVEGQNGRQYIAITRKQKIQTIPRIMLDLQAIRLQSPTAAVADALQRTQQTCRSPQRAMCDVPRQCFQSQRRLTRFVHHVRAAHARYNFFF